MNKKRKTKKQTNRVPWTWSRDGLPAKDEACFRCSLPFCDEESAGCERTNRKKNTKK